MIVPPRDIAPVMKQAIVAIEDRRFFEHRGVDLHAIFRAVWADVTHRQRRPGRIDDHAAVHQERLRPQRPLDQPQAQGGGARLAARAEVVEGPDPDRVPEYDLLRQRRLRDPAGRGDLFPPQRQDAEPARGRAPGRDPAGPDAVRPGGEPEGGRGAARRRAARDVRARRHHRRRAAHGDERGASVPGDVHLPGTQGPAQYFVNYVKQQLVDRCGSSQVFGGGLRVTTTIDLGLQQLAQTAISKWLTHPGGPSAALVAIDPRNGEVKAMIGGDNFRESQFNLAVQGERQPGSSFKPFVLATALQDGISPDDRVRLEAGRDLHRRSRLGRRTTTKATTSAAQTSRRRRPTPTTRSMRS